MTLARSTAVVALFFAQLLHSSTVASTIETDYPTIAYHSVPKYKDILYSILMYKRSLYGVFREIVVVHG